MDQSAGHGRQVRDVLAEYRDSMGEDDAAGGGSREEDRLNMREVVADLHDFVDDYVRNH